MVWSKRILRILGDGVTIMKIKPKMNLEINQRFGNHIATKEMCLTAKENPVQEVTTEECGYKTSLNPWCTWTKDMLL